MPLPRRIPHTAAMAIGRIFNFISLALIECEALFKCLHIACLMTVLMHVPIKLARKRRNPTNFHEFARPRRDRRSDCTAFTRRQ